MDKTNPGFHDFVL